MAIAEDGLLDAVGRDRAVGAQVIVARFRAGGHRTQRPRTTKQQTRPQYRARQQQREESRLTSWRFLLSRAQETANRFWRHNDLIEVKDRPYESHTKRI